MYEKPLKRPYNPSFSSGPCPKFKGWKLADLDAAVLGRSHRSKLGKNKLEEALKMTKDILKLPQDYVVGIVPGSDTGAIELAMWNFLGYLGVDVLAWESFSSDWLSDIVGELKLDNVNKHIADYGLLPNLENINFENDVVFVWNGTTSGVKVPNGEWIPDNRQGLTICDATSAVFAMEMPWEKLDVVTYSWQKVLGGEAAHGILILSPKAIQRLSEYTPKWPIPKLFKFSMCLPRLSHPFSTADKFSSPNFSLVIPPFILRALTVATKTTADGFKFAFLHFIFRNFSAPKSAPNPASVTT